MLLYFQQFQHIHGEKNMRQFFENLVSEVNQTWYQLKGIHCPSCGSHDLVLQGQGYVDASTIPSPALLMTDSVYGRFQPPRYYEHPDKAYVAFHTRFRDYACRSCEHTFQKEEEHGQEME